MITAPDAAQWAGWMLKYDPSPASWKKVLDSAWQSNLTFLRGNNDAQLDLARLSVAAGAMQTTPDYDRFVGSARTAAAWGELKAVVEQGRQSGVLSSTQLGAEYADASRRFAEAKAGVPMTEADAKKKPTGDFASYAGNGYLTFAEYPKAVENYRLALSKGGVDAGQINTRLGIALAKSGDMAGAKSAFEAVTGAYKPIADMWLLWVNSKAA